MTQFFINDKLPIGTEYKTRSGKKAVYGGIDIIKGYLFSVGDRNYYTDCQGMYYSKSRIDPLDIIGHWEEKIPGAINIEKPHKKIVSMIVHNGIIHIATEYMVMRYVDDTWETILKFEGKS